MIDWNFVKREAREAFLTYFLPVWAPFRPRAAWAFLKRRLSA